MSFYSKYVMEAKQRPEAITYGIGYHQTFEHPIGPLNKQPELGRWFCVRGSPEVIPNWFEPLPGLPFDGKHILKFPKDTEFVVLPNQIFKEGQIRLHCCRQASELEERKGYAVRWTVENSLNEVIASVRYGPEYQFEVSNDGINYESCGISWEPNLNNFFSITIDLDNKNWHTYFKNAKGAEKISKTIPIGCGASGEISHMRIINGQCLASYSVEIGIGRADKRNEYGILYYQDG